MSILAFSALVGVVLAGAIALTVLSLRRRAGSGVAVGPGARDEIAMVFENGRLKDADDAIWPLLPWSEDGARTWSEVRTALSPIIPDLPETLPAAPMMASEGQGPRVAIDVIGDTLRVVLSPSADMESNWFAARQNGVKLAQLEPALACSPNPVWSVTDAGEVIWGNAAFEALADAYDSAAALAAHFTEQLDAVHAASDTRVSVRIGEAQRLRWFEVTSRETATGRLFFATAVDAVVQAEEAQRNFVQTLSKTFANLTTGLAIFDRNRRLALFNPALIDLCGVSAEFLSGRPNLFEFFDKLRDQQIMPEPKNYDNWRECMAKLVAAASDDRFRETWTLADGQTFDVTGRPYPDGAIAFLFNDITAEVSLTRGFRTELETMQSALDAMEDAVAIFSQQGVLTVSNAAYQAMWNVDPDTRIADTTILETTQEWKSAFHPDPVWPELRDYVTTTRDRASWDSELRSKDGREVICRVDPICYGATMIRFCVSSKRRSDSDGGEPLQIVSA